MTYRRRHESGWTLVELLVVLGVIALLLGLLIPVIVKARQHAAMVTCQANLRTLGQPLFVYAGENDGWLYPVDRDPATDKLRDYFGTQVPPHARWPAIVFKVPAASMLLPYDPESYTLAPYDPVNFPAAPFTPAVLLCPADDEPLEAHTYVLNGHLGQRGFRRGNRDLGGRTSGEVVLAGEKRPEKRDYYLQDDDFDRGVVHLFRHGESKGSNYLFLDGHVALQLPRDARGGIDPWDVKRAAP